MAQYTDGYLLPLSENKVDAYRKMSGKAGKIFRRHGAVSYREYIASDLNVMENIVPFPQVIKIQSGETLIYATVGFESEARRNEIVKRVFDDEEMRLLMSGELLFDYKRMAYGGFELLVEV